MFCCVKFVTDPTGAYVCQHCNCLAVSVLHYSAENSLLFRSSLVFDKMNTHDTDVSKVAPLRITRSWLFLLRHCYFIPSGWL
jgi:hypothetical protein